MTLGERIQELRKKKGYTQERLAEHLNLSRQAVAKWEQNACEPNLACLAAMAELFEVDLDYLITGKQKEPLPVGSESFKPSAKKKNTKAILFSVLGAVGMMTVWMSLAVTVVLGGVGFFLNRYMEAEQAGSQGLGYTSNGDGTCYVWNASHCTDTDVVIPRRSPQGYLVTGIDKNAFARCSEVTSITVPDSVTSISEYAFGGCPNLAAITVAEGNPVYHSDGNCLIDTQKKEVIVGCLTSVIPSDGSVTSIGSRAFYGKNLTAITIPEGVTDVKEEAFYRCDLLTSVTLPTSVTGIGDGAFYGCESLTDIVIPEGVTGIGERVFEGCVSLSRVTIPESVTSIGGYAFSGCSSLTEITLPDSVTDMGKGVFSRCESLTDVTFPKGLKSIAGSTFYDCKSLTEITIPEGITEIGSGAFAYCSNVNYVTLPVSVTHVGKEAFKLCYGIKAVYYGGTKAQWESITVDEDNEYLTNRHYIHCADGDVVHW